MKKYEIRMKGDPRYLTTLISEEDFKVFKSMSSKDLRDSRPAWSIANLFTQLRAWFQTEDGSVIQQSDPFWKDVTIDDFTLKTNDEFLTFLRERQRNINYSVKFHPMTGKRRFVANICTPEMDAELFGETIAELFIRFYFAAYTNRILRTERGFEHYVDKWVMANRYHAYENMVKDRNEYLESMGTVVEAIEQQAEKQAEAEMIDADTTETTSEETTTEQ